MAYSEYKRVSKRDVIPYKRLFIHHGGINRLYRRQYSCLSYEFDLLLDYVFD